MPSPQVFCHYPGLPVPLEIPVSTAPPQPCPYLPGRTAVSRGFGCQVVPGWAYQLLMDAGFRRSGRVFYQPICPGCRACVAVRVPVAGFLVSKGQRRVEARNGDLRLELGPPVLTDEKHALYRAYLEARHDGQMGVERGEFEDFLYRSPTDTVEVCYRAGDGRLLAVGICDRTPLALSSVYFYFDPEENRRSLGIFGMLAEVRLACSLRLPYYYPGFWVEGCPKMAYKARLRPLEFLGTDGTWRAFPAPEASPFSG